MLGSLSLVCIADSYICRLYVTGRLLSDLKQGLGEMIGVQGKYEVENWRKDADL